MFLQNQISELPNHFTLIREMIVKSDEIRLVVAYIRKNGVDELKDSFKNKNIKLLCSFDMGITDPIAIEELLNLGVQVKVYLTNEGTFHSKIWLFKQHDKWNCIIGSANLTRAALYDNVEASVFINNENNFNGVIEQSLIFFNYLWDSEFSKEIDKEELIAWKNKISSRKTIRDAINQIDPETFQNKTDILFNFVKNWIDIDKYEKENGVIGNLWRGWYIIPDQGYITDDKMTVLQNICKAILENGGTVHLETGDQAFNKILGELERKFVRESHTMSSRQLFIRQEKNYLIKFGFTAHPLKPNGKLDKQILILTSLGKEIAKCDTLICIKNLYTTFLEEYSYNGLKILRFTRKLLEKIKHISFEEFNYFVIHAYTDDEIDEISNLILLFRKLDDNEKSQFNKKVRDYFKEIKEPTASNVLGNYDKKVKHTMSALGWANGIICDFENWKLSIIE